MYNIFRASNVRELVSVQMLTSLHMYLGGSHGLSQRTMTGFEKKNYMQALSKSGDSIRLEFIVIVDLVKNIAHLLKIALKLPPLVSKKVADILHPF